MTEKRTNVKQRLTGALVLIALAVIFLPIFLNGDGRQQALSLQQEIHQPPAPPQSRLKAPVQSAITPPVAPLVQDWKKHLSAARESVNTAINTTDQQQADVRQVKSWAVQVGSFGNKDNALKLRNRLRNADFPAYIQDITDQNKPIYRVRIGPVRSHEKASLMSQQVSKSEKRETLVVAYQ